MSVRVITFVEEWVDERVHPGVFHDEEGPAERIASLREQLLLDADAAGIPRQEIELEYPDLGGDIALALGILPDQNLDGSPRVHTPPLSQRIDVLEMWKQDLETELGEFDAGSVVVKRNAEDVTGRVRQRLELDLTRIQALIDSLKEPPA